MLDKLSNILKKTTDRIANALFLDQELVDSIVKDLQRALLEADVNVHIVKQLTDKIKKAAFDERIKGVEKKEHLIKLLHDELLAILGTKKELILQDKQNRIMLVGLYGSGKTTTIAKIANYFAKRGKRVAIVGLDVHRPAAKEQLEQLGKQHNLTVFIDKKENNALKTYKSFEKQLEKYEVILIDTAGRDALEDELIDEMSQFSKYIKPTEVILVLPADIGQTAKKQASEFQKATKITGVIITRMDSSAKGGGAITACAETQAPVYFITTGEKVNDIESFNPESFLSRLLGMGDLQTLLEKIQSATNQNKQKQLEKSLQEGKISLTDVVEQVKSMNEMGGFAKIKDMIPGMSKAQVPQAELDKQENKAKKWEHILKSMTPEEINNPELLEKQTSRIARIAKGSGTTTSQIRELLKQYALLNDFVKDSASFDPSKGFSQKQMMKMAKKFGKKKFKF